MWSSVTERRIGTAGVSSTAAAGSSRRQPAQRVEDRLDQRADLRSRDGVVADMRRDDLGGKGEQLAPVDALVLGHLRPLRWHPATASAARAISVATAGRQDRRAASNRASPPEVMCGNHSRAGNRVPLPDHRPVLPDRSQAPPGGCTSLLDWPAAPRAAGLLFPAPHSRARTSPT